MNTKQWTQIFKALANINRVKIIKLLISGRDMNVGEISDEIDISLKATSKHLILLDTLDVLCSKGTKGHVFYSLNADMPKDFKSVIQLLK